MRILVDERRIVARLLAGGPLAVPVCQLVDEDLRAIAVAVLALRSMGEPPVDERVVAIARALGHPISGRDVEALLREGSFRRAA